MPRPTTYCTVGRCGEPNFGLGMCRVHYRRNRRYGSPLAYRPTTVGRFWSKVSLPDANGCMLWLGAISPGTLYGSFKSVRTTDSTAHRFSLWLAEGTPPEADMEAAHSCRNRHCVAPAHLRWATRLENVHDMYRDGTIRLGSTNALSKLSEDQVAELRRRYAIGGVTQQQLADDSGVSQSTIRKAIHGLTWKTVKGA